MNLRSIAWKFMLKGTEQGRFSVMTLVAWIAIAVGVAAMCCLLSVMYGFERTLQDRFLNAYPHVIVRPRQSQETIGQVAEWTEKLRNIPSVKRLLPFIETEMILQVKQRALGAVVWGMEISDLNQLESGLSEGRLPNPDAKIPEVLVGRELGLRMGLSPGSSLRVISPIRKTGLMGLAPQSENFLVAGLYASGHYEFDQQYIYLPLEDAQDLLQMDGKITGWHLWAEQQGDSERLERDVSAVIPQDWKAESWHVFNSALFSSLRLEQYSMFSILSFAVLIAVLNIVITLLMHVTHKRKNIGILRALGASQSQIRKIFLWQGLWMGGIGLGSGAILASLVLIYLKYFSTLQLPEIYYDRSIPVEVRPFSIALIFSVATVMIYLATLLPSRRAAAIDPIEAIRE